MGAPTACPARAQTVRQAGNAGIVRECSRSIITFDGSAREGETSSDAPLGGRARLAPMRRRSPFRTSRRWQLAAAFLAIVSLLVAAFAQPADGDTSPVPALRGTGGVLIDLVTLARRYGWSVSEHADALTVRAGGGILTAFAGAPDALWHPTGQSEATVVPLSVPPQRTHDGWFVPEDLLEVLGVRRAPDGVPVPGGMAPLAFPPEPEAGDGYELAELSPGIVALRFFAPGPTGPNEVSLMLSDLTLLALVVPEHRQALDAVLVDGALADGHPLLVTVTALAPATWDPSLTFEQGDMRFEARHPFRFQLVSGSATEVAPAAPAIGAVLLPERFDLEEPLRIRWGDRSAEVTFRPGR